MTPLIIRQASSFVLNQKQPEYHRFLHYRIDFNERLIGIKGPRGSGKTTLMLQYAHLTGIAKEKIFYAACDHPAMIDLELYDLAQEFYQEDGKLLLIDEIHKRKGFGRSLKAIRDTFGLQVIFSGSSALRIDHELADLSRRAVVYELPVLSLREFMELETGLSFTAYPLQTITFKHQSISAEVCSQVRPIEYFKKYLEYGAYPFYLESKTSYIHKLLEVINITIDSDLCLLYNIEPVKLEKLKKILYMLCSSPPSELNKSKLSSAVGASWPTLSKYLERMQAAGLIYCLRAGSGMRTVNRPDKLILNNPNLYFSLCANPNTGAIRETFFISQLSQGHQVHYYDQGDFVVDDQFIFEIGGRSKSNRQIRGQDNAFIVADDIEIGSLNQVPLWAFGMTY